MTDQPMNYRDYLIRQHQQERMAQEFDSLFTSDEDHAAAATRAIEDQAHNSAQEAVATYDYVQESLTDAISQSRDLRARIQSGTLPEKDARKLLANLRQHRAELVAKIAPTKISYDGAQATLKDPDPTWATARRRRGRTGS